MRKHKNSRSLNLWNIITILAISFLSIFLPLRIIAIDMQSAGLSLYCVATLILVIDFILHLGEYYFISKTDESKLFAIPFLLVDLIGAIPFLFIAAIPIVQLLQLLKLLRLGQFLNRTMEIALRQKRVLTILFFLFWLGLAIHWLSCIWLAIISIDPSFDHYTNYVRSLYWIITTLTSVGYGDILPVGNIQMWYAMFVQLLGIGAFGYLIAHVVGIVSKKDPVETQYSENVELLSATLKHRSLPRNLQSRIMNYYRYMRKEKIGYDESAFLDTLPSALRTEVAIDIRKEFIHEIPLFKNAGDSFISQVAMKLDLFIATPGDYFFKFGESGTEMYLIISGTVEVIAEDGETVLATLVGGDYFGEIALFDSTRRNASVRALEFCNLYKLEKEIFDEVVADNPQIALEIEKKARFRGKR